MTPPSSTNPKTERCGRKGEKNHAKTCILCDENACQKCQCLSLLNLGVSQIHEIAIRLLQLSAPNDSRPATAKRFTVYIHEIREISDIRNLTGHV
jgi:hypothetical protein